MNAPLRTFSGAVLALLLMTGPAACAAPEPDGTPDGATTAAHSGAIHGDVPDSVDPRARYLIYLHGAIIETQGRRPTHPELGVYEYDQILGALAARGFQVISEARPAGTEVPAYAAKVAAQVRRLADAGVPPERIAVAGHSKGGMITIGASSLLDLPDVRFVILAGCFGGISRVRDTPLSGHVLSIYDATDRLAGSCAPLFAQAEAAGRGPLSHDEIRIDTGHGHGAFYEPREAWLAPIVRWLTVGGREAGPPGR